MADDEVTRSLLAEYSIAEVNAEISDGNEIGIEIQRESLRDAFSRYAKVIFHDIADSYPTDADVQCSFSLTLDMKQKEGDVVGLFRLGWRNPSEMIMFQPVPKPNSEDQRDFQVQFRASELPKDEGEIYQLCYISQNEVWGASVPFEFRRATAEELLVVDSGDLVIVRSQSAVVEDLKCQVATLRKDLIASEASSVDVGKKFAEIQEENKSLKNRLKDLEKIEQVLERLRADNQALDDAHNASEDKLRENELVIESLNCMICSLRKDLQVLKEQFSAQSEELAREKAKSQNVTNQCGCTQDLIDALREGKECAVREMRKALAENEELKLQINEACEEKKKLLEKVEEHEKLYKTALDNEEASARRIEELLAQLTQITSDSQAEICKAKSRNDMYQKKFKNLEEDMLDKCRIIQCMKTQLQFNAQMLQESASRQQSAQTVSEVARLQSRLVSVQTRHKQVWIEIKELRAELKTLEETENSLIESQKSLTEKVKSLHNSIAEAEGCENTLEASLHQKELDHEQAELEELNVCIESANHRRNELEKQLTKLQHDRIILDRQEVEIVATLAQLTKTDCYPGGSTKIFPDSRNLVLPPHFYQTAESGNSQTTDEVADLRERLRQAAEAYKSLYQEKLQAERQFRRLQERHCQGDALE